MGSAYGISAWRGGQRLGWAKGENLRIFHSQRLRAWFSVSVSILSRGTVTLNNIILVPVLLSAWGTEVYGEWLILTAVGTFAQIAGLGFVQSTIAEIIGRFSSGDRLAAERAITTTSWYFTVVTIGVLGVSAVLLFAFDVRPLLGIRVLSNGSAAGVILVSMAAVMFAFFATPSYAALGAVVGNGLAEGVYMSTKIGEIVAIVIGASLGATPVVVAAIPVVSALTWNVALPVMRRRIVPELKVGRPRLDRPTFRHLLKISMSQFLLFISMTVVVPQLPRVVLGSFTDAVHVAIFSVAMTYTRAARSFATIIAQSLQIELARAFAEKREGHLRRLAEAVCQVSLWMAVILALSLWVVAKPAFAMWTHGKIDADYRLIAIMAVGAVIGSYSDSFSYFLISINRVRPSAIAHITGSIGGLAAGALLFPLFGIYGMAAALILPEAAAAIVGLWRESGILALSPGDLLEKSLQPPIGLIRHEGARAYAAMASKLGGLR